jgi:serine/threonine protein kinase/Flp pilus assembly protein TadD
MTAVDPSRITQADPALELDNYVAAFEAAAAAGAQPAVENFLPPPNHPIYAAALPELIRVDLELAWSRGTRRTVEDYRDRFPQVFADRSALRDLLHEEFRLRRAAGELPETNEGHARFGMEPENRSYNLLQTDRLFASVPEWPHERIPEVGDTIPPGYRLVGELGRGAFGRVFLARETELGGRPVAIKIATQLAGESLTLARLQHTNIVPIYAAHRVGRSTAIVMPFLGRMTLGDLLVSFRSGRVPQSGHGVVSTLAARAQSTAGGTESGSPGSVTAPAPGRSRAVLDALERMSFTETVLWIGAELSDGLAHAHERGILHRDIKPANVLLTDDGRPMLLDFNLAAAGPARVAGTPAYMAPEQLAAAQKNRGLATPQSDIYAIGLLMLELLAGRLPFDEPHGRWEEMVPQMLKARSRQPLDDLALPRDVTPGVRAILAKCLEPEPAHRYTSAAELREDLNRQRSNQPLRYARERSVRESARKWIRRHPRLSSGGSIAAFALLAIGFLAAAYLGNRWRLGQREAELAHARLRDAREFTQSGASDSPVGEWRAIRDAAVEALAPYRVESDEWTSGRLVVNRPASERTELRRDAAQVMFRAAEASAAIARTEPAARERLLAEALEWNRRARAANPGAPTRPLLKQQATLLHANGRSSEASDIEANAVQLAPPEADDLLGQGLTALYARNFADAATKLRTAAATGPPRYSVWMGLAAAEMRLGRLSVAIDSLSAASALRPMSPWSFFHRGLARLELKDYAAAATDFDRFLELEPTDPDGYLNRAIARLMTHDNRGALADCNSAEQHHCTATRLYSIRELARRGLGDQSGADRDLRTFLAATPTDPLSWCARGERKLTLERRDVPGAIRDFNEAVALDAGFLNALRDKASVLAEDPASYGEAIALLDRVLEVVPNSLSDRAGRAVLLARAGKSAEALREVRECANGSGDALIDYQLASAALIANDKPRGLRLLRSALRKDPSFAAQMPADSDLKSVWMDSDFLNLIAAAKTLSHD